MPYDETIIKPRKKIKRTRKESEEEEGHPFAIHTDDSQEKPADKQAALAKLQAKTKLTSKIEAAQRAEAFSYKDQSPTRPPHREFSPSRPHKEPSPTRPPVPPKKVSVRPQPMLHVDHPEVPDLGTPPVVYMPPHTQGQVAPPQQKVTPSMASRYQPQVDVAPMDPSRPTMTTTTAPSMPSKPGTAPMPSTTRGPQTTPIASDIKPQISAQTKATPTKTKELFIMPPPPEERKPPTFLKFINHCRVKPGEEGRFEAQVTGKPQPTIKWFRDGQELIPSIICKVDTKPNGITTLTLPKVQLPDSGKITCKIENAAGLASCTAKLIVEGM